MKVTTFDDTNHAISVFLRRLDRLIDEARAELDDITPSKASTYEMKIAEAKAYPEDGPHPILEAEAKAKGIAVEEVAAGVIRARRAYQESIADLELARFTAKREIQESINTKEMHDILERLREELITETR